jgi:hypothetical protein
MGSINDAVEAGTAFDQKQTGTHRMHHLELEEQFRDLMQAGIQDVGVSEKVLKELLRGFETVRVTQEREIMRLNTETAYCRARQRAASEHANLIIAILTTTVRNIKDTKLAEDKKNAETTEKPQKEDTPPGVVTEEEFFKTHCACACQDEADAKACACRCHKGHPCKILKCQVCPAWRNTTVRPDTIINTLPSKSTPVIKAKPTPTTKSKPTKAKKAKKPRARS